MFHKLASLDLARGVIGSTVFSSPPVVSVPVYSAVGRVCAVDVRSPVSVPFRPVAAMDGFAVRVSDGVRFRVVGAVRAGVEPPVLGFGEAYFVEMGAPLPIGADAVARVEASRVEGGYVEPLEPLRPGKDVMPVGEVVGEGELIAVRGEVLSPYKVALMLMAGVREVKVYDFRVTVYSVGGELDRFDEPRGKPVIDSFAPMVMGLLKFARVKYGGVLNDDVGEIAGALESSLGDSDIIVTIGGASVGETDNVKMAASKVGKLLFPGVSASILKRGAVAVADGKAIVMLPGQCVSAALVLHEHLLHVASKMAGGELREYVEAELAETLEVKHRMDTAYLFKLESGKAKPLKWGVNLCGELAKADAFTVLKRGVHEKGEKLILQKLIK
ncbi:MAG: molybdopterin molybdotransferase MoeA [Thermoprotei archaeon]|nr:molybdopterin molybdotransferase MoeA [Thermoprotei archaeon]